MSFAIWNVNYNDFDKNTGRGKTERVVIFLFKNTDNLYLYNEHIVIISGVMS